MLHVCMIFSELWMAHRQGFGLAGFGVLPLINLPESVFQVIALLIKFIVHGAIIAET